jgi:hypothetical protein
VVCYHSTVLLKVVLEILSGYDFSEAGFY